MPSAEENHHRENEGFIQPNEQREQKPNLFGLCRVASEEEVFNPQLLILLTVGIYRTHLELL